MRTFAKILGALAFCGLSSLAVGCGGDDADGGESEAEVITTVGLTFTPAAGGSAIVALVNDLDGDGGNLPITEPVNLTAGSYTLGVTFENRLETPAGNITQEIKDEADEHQIFLLGTAVNGPASNQMTAPLTHAYADMDANGLPIGLANTITASAGSGNLKVVLRHLPPINGMAVKVATLADTVRTSGLAAIGGGSDAEVTFPVTVSP